MTDSKSENTKQKPADKGNAVVVVLIVLVLVAAGAIAYLSGQVNPTTALEADEPSQTASVETPETAEPVSTETAQTSETSEEVAASETSAEEQASEIVPGNPVVAKVGAEDITRIDVLNFIRTLGAASQQVPLDQLFPMALNQVVNDKIVAKQAETVNLDDNPLVQERLEQAKSQIVRAVFMQQELESAITEERLKAAYDEYLQKFPEVPEVKVRHILVEDEALAKELIVKLGNGEDFTALVAQHSTDPTKDNGGDLGYLSRQDRVLPEFLDGAFALKTGEVSTTPVKTEYGYHVIEVLEERVRPPAEYDVAKPFLESQLRNVVLSELIDGWRAKADVELFDINGEAIEPAAGVKDEDEKEYTQPVEPKEAVE